MNLSISRRLVNDLSRHPPLTPEIDWVDWEGLVRLLELTYVPISKRFYEGVAANTQRIPDSANSQYHTLSIRRVLRNENVADAAEYSLAWHKRLYHAAAAKLGIYDSEIFARNLRSSPELVQMMSAAASSGQPHSLLARLDTFDEIDGKTSSMPIVVIPEADIARVIEWERSMIRFNTPSETSQVRQPSRSP